MTTRLDRLQQALASKTLVKAIAGIDNRNLDDILSMAKAASQAGVTALDMTADPTLVAQVRAAYDGVLFASSVLPTELAAAIEAGADVAELGNYDALYAEGLFLTAEEVMQLAKTAKELLPAGTPLCVTIPGHLAPWTQAYMAEELEKLDVALIQTEGASRLLSQEPQVAALTVEQKMEVSLANTRLLVGYTSIPVMTASGITAFNAGSAIEAGASGVGIGTFVSSIRSGAGRQSALQDTQATVEQAAQGVSPLMSLVS